MASGINVPDEVKTLYEEFKIRKTNKFILYGLSDDFKTIIIEHKEPETLSEAEKNALEEDAAKERFEEFKQKVLATDNPRFCIVDVICWKSEPNGGKRRITKIALLLWCPDTLPVKKKMVFASSTDAIKKKLGKGFKEIQCSEISEFDYDEISKELAK